MISYLSQCEGLDPKVAGAPLLYVRKGSTCDRNGHHHSATSMGTVVVMSLRPSLRDMAVATIVALPL